MAIRALLELWDDLHENYGVSFLLTNRLNQNCVENLFSVICVKGGHRDNLDASQFRMAFRQIMEHSLLITSEKANCEKDVDDFYLKNIQSEESFLSSI